MRRHKAVTIFIILLVNASVFFFYNDIAVWIGGIMPGDANYQVDITEIAPPSETLRTSLYADEFIEIGISHDGAGDDINGNIVDYIVLEGITHNSDKGYIMLAFEDPKSADEADKTIYQQTFGAPAAEPFSIAVAVPDTELERLNVQIYTNSEQYGTFASWVYDSVVISKDGNGWQFERRMDIYKRNYELYMSAKSTLPDESIYISDAVRELSDAITADCETDYQKLVAIHDWVCENIYYDYDVFNSSGMQDIAPDDIIKSRRTMCSGYAQLTRALVLAQGIPCIIAEGYALGIQEDSWDNDKLESGAVNHDWNEAYADGRWVIMDNTWDSKNRYENGEYETVTNCGYTYFDSDLSFFSLKHSVLRYK